MKLIVGLGNPGKRYKNTRHNVGFEVVERLRDELQRGKGSGVRLRFQELKRFKAKVAKLDSLLLIKPQTFMNKSGECVAGLVNFYKISLDDLYIAHDDLDISWGESKLQKNKGPKDHKGINSIEDHLEGSEFWRMRVGVDGRVGGQKRIPGENYVLMKYDNQEREEMNETLDEVVRKLVGEL